jgi:hydrogenase maturation protease
MDGKCSTLVLGLGNPILGDDGVGWRAAEAFRTQWEAGLRPGFPSSTLSGEERLPVEVDFLSVGGLTLMERMIGYQRVVLIDAALTRQHPIGEVSCFPFEQLPPITQGHLASSHDTTLQNALAVGRSMGADLPSEIWVVAIEAQNMYEFTEQLSPAVASAVSTAAEAVFSIIKSFFTAESQSSQNLPSSNSAILASLR